MQWSITWDGSAGGYRGVAGELETAAYVNPQAVISAIGQGNAAKRRSLLAEQVEGLVPIQQSSQPLQTPVFDKKTALQKMRDLRPVERATARRWNITVWNASSGEYRVIDSKAGRLRKCQNRIRAWADTIEKVAPRRVRRATKKEQKHKKKDWIEYGPRLVMLTLTYADANTAHKKSDGWKPNHIQHFMKTVKRKLADNLLGSAWVMEMQERDTPHYHVMLYVQRGTDVPEPDTAGWWKHGSTRRETAKSAYYLVKYTGKEYQKEGLPRGARMFAPWVKKGIPSKLMFNFRLSAIPAWLATIVKELAKELGHDMRWKRNIGGGWLIRDTGELLQSPWKVISIDLAEEAGSSLAEDDEYG